MGVAVAEGRHNYSASGVHHLKGTIGQNIRGEGPVTIGPEP